MGRIRLDLLFNFKIRKMFLSVRMEHPQCGWAHPQPYISLNRSFCHFFAPFHFHNSKPKFLSSKPLTFFPKPNLPSPLPSPLVFSSISPFFFYKTLVFNFSRRFFGFRLKTRIPSDFLAIFTIYNKV